MKLCTQMSLQPDPGITQAHSICAGVRVVRGRAGGLLLRERGAGCAQQGSSTPCAAICGWQADAVLTHASVVQA